MITRTYVNINGKDHLLALVQGHSVSTFYFFFSLDTPKRIETKIHLYPPRDGGTKVCSNGLGHMTNIATMPIYDKRHLKIFFSGTTRPMTLKLCMQHRVLQNYQIYSNDVPGLTETYFMARSNLVPYAFLFSENGKAMDFSDTV